jgi:hypothetical protein
VYSEGDFRWEFTLDELVAPDGKTTILDPARIASWPTIDTGARSLTLNYRLTPTADPKAITLRQVEFEGKKSWQVSIPLR